MLTVDQAVDCLLDYGLACGLIEPVDRIASRNALLALLGKDDYTPSASTDDSHQLTDILDVLVEHAVSSRLIAGSPASRDLLDTALMGVLTPRPSAVAARFWSLAAQSPREATDYFYRFSQDVNYIRRDRTARDQRWTTATEYGELDITINLAKPEKDPRDIAAARTRLAMGYPACVLCAENEGYAGRIDHPARQNLRIIPIDILGEPWGFQYSPYVYYNEHCIVLNTRHVPMVIDDSVFRKLFDFVRLFPHYFVGSNADLPVVGGSILSHEHFQGGNYEFAMARAPIERHFAVAGFADVEAGVVHWPMSVIRLRHIDPETICRLASVILRRWREYTDESAFIFARTGSTPHNTITPIARQKDGVFELDLVLRNNITTPDHPLGLYHPHEELHNIKKENIGLIEVMGLAVLPSRLAIEMQELKTALLAGADVAALPSVSHHARWAAEWLRRRPDFSKSTAESVIRDEIGRTFNEVLHHAGVFARNQAGQSAFDSFIATL